MKGPPQQRGAEGQEMHLPTCPSKVTITRSCAQPGLCFLAEGTRVYIMYITGFLVTKVGVPHVGGIKASRLCCYHFATLNKAQGLQRCLGYNTDLSPALRRSTVVAPISLLVLCPSAPCHPAWETTPWSSPVVTSATGQLPHISLSRSALSHPMLGPLLVRTHPNMYPACVSTKGRFDITNKQLSTEPLMVTKEPWNLSLPCRWCGHSKHSEACMGTSGGKGRKHADLSSLKRLNFLLSLNLAPEPFWWRLPSQTMCSVFLTRIRVRVEIPFISRLGFLLLFSGKKKEKEPKGRTRQTESPLSLFQILQRYYFILIMI